MNNVVGKMLIVMQLVFSILFMCFAGAVYTFQGQWREKANTLTERVAVVEQQYKDEKEKHDSDVLRLTERAKDAEDRQGEAEAQLQNAQVAAQQLEGQLDDVQLQRDKAIADAQVASTEAAARVVESQALNKEVQSLRIRIAELRDQIQGIEDELLDGQGKLAGAEEMEEQLLAEIADLKDLLRLNGIDPRIRLADGQAPDQIERVEGKVKDKFRNSNRTQELVQITVGSDDKIYKDMTLIVYRGAKYICQMRVMKVYPDTAVCVVKESTRNGLVEVDDDVTTKL